MARTLARRFACESTTPLGLPVLPEVYCRNPMSPALLRTGLKFPSFEPLKSAVTKTFCSDSTCARNKYAKGLASGIVIMIEAPALLSIPTWRVMWSSMLDSRAGGYSGTGTPPASSTP